MAYIISKSNLPAAPSEIAKVDSMEAARAFFERKCEAFTCDPELIFEIDPDGHDAADVAIIAALSMEVYTVEAAA